MRPARLVPLAVVAALALSACASSSPGWTYAPIPATPTPAPSASAAPSSGASTAPGSSAPGSSAPGSAAPGGTVLTVTAANIAFDKTSLTAPANQSFQIQFTNNDAGVPHNVTIHQGSASGTVVFKGDLVTGVASTTYTVPALPAGSYTFVCIVHPNMVGTLTIQ